MNCIWKDAAQRRADVAIFNFKMKGTAEPAETILSMEQREKREAMEKVMNHGMDFLAGMFKMVTGQDAGFEGKKMEIDSKTGEVVMRFKLPSF